MPGRGECSIALDQGLAPTRAKSLRAACMKRTLQALQITASSDDKRRVPGIQSGYDAE
jgi:hypothetical protein